MSRLHVIDGSNVTLSEGTQNFYNQSDKNLFRELFTLRFYDKDSSLCSALARKVDEKISEILFSATSKREFTEDHTRGLVENLFLKWINSWMTRFSYSLLQASSLMSLVNFCGWRGEPKEVMFRYIKPCLLTVSIEFFPNFEFLFKSWTV